MSEFLSMFHLDPGHQWWDFVVRAAFIYVFLLVALRVLGSRPLAQLSKFDVILLMVLANAVQNAMNAGDNSVLAAIVLVITLMTMNHALHRFVFKHRRLESLIEGSPQVIIHNGQIVSAVAASANLTDEDIRAELRKTGCADPASVRWAILEADGHISVIPHYGVAPPVAGGTQAAL
jgi:uncharacterized membrane protein YcaP (DUF421 family)